MNTEIDMFRDDWEMVDPIWAEQREARRLLSHKRAYIQWRKVFDDPVTGRLIYHFRYLRFAYREYHKNKETRKLVSLFVRPTGMTLQVLRGNHVEKVVLSCRDGKLRVFRVKVKAITRMSPFAMRVKENNPTTQGCHFRDSAPGEHAGWVRNEKRLIKLFASIARKNKVRIPDLSKCSTLADAIICVYYPAYREMVDFGIEIGVKGASYDLSLIAPHLRLPFKEFLKALCGHDSKAVTRFVLDKENATLRLKQLMVLNVLKGLVPLDYLYRVFVAPCLPEFYHRESRSQIRKFLKCYSPQTIIKWMTTPVMIPAASGTQIPHIGSYLSDMVHMFFAIRKTNPAYFPLKSTDIVEVHNDLARTHRRIGVENRDIKHPKILLDKKLEGTRLGDYTLVLPKTTHELMDWGEEMNNCIGGYADLIERGYSWILGCRDRHGKIVYGIELTPATDPTRHYALIRQFKGKHNAEARTELQDGLLEILAVKGMKQVPHEDPVLEEAIPA